MQPSAPLISKDTRARIERHIRALASPEQDIAVKAENRLIAFGAKAVKLLLPVVEHPEPMARLRAGWILGISKDPRAFEPLCRLLSDPDDRVRYDAAFALGHLGDERAIPVLWQAVENTDDVSLSSGAAMGLGRFGIHPFPNDE